MSGARARFDAALREAEEALACEGELVCDLRFGERVVRIRFAGAALADALMPALAARRDERASADWTVIAWRGAGAAPEHSDRLVRRGPAGRVHSIEDAASATTTLVDEDGRLILHRAGELPWWERAAPLRAALFMALGGPRSHLVHGGCVGDRRRGGVLLGGRGGSGKTTTALASLEAGLDYVADDYVLLELEPIASAVNLYGTAKLDDGHLSRLPSLAPFATRSSQPAAEEKYVVDLARHFPDRLAASLPLRALVLPRIGERTRIEPLSPARAVLGIAPSSALQMPYDDGAVLTAISRLASSLPCFSLEVGPRPDELAQAIESILDRVGVEAAA